MNSSEQKPEMPLSQTEHSEQKAEALAEEILAGIEEKQESVQGIDTEVLEQEIAELKDRALRAAAEAENTRKRALKDIEETKKYAVSTMAGDMVEVCENLHRALENLPDSSDEESAALKSLRMGVELTRKSLMDVFEKHGIRRLTPMGEPFDPHFHQAMAQIETPDKPANTVVQVMQSGYILRDRLLRPALVAVSKAVDPQKKVDTTV